MLNNPNATHATTQDGFELNVNETEYPYRVFGVGLRDQLYGICLLICVQKIKSNLRCFFPVILGIVIDESNELCNELAQGFRSEEIEVKN